MKNMKKLVTVFTVVGVIGVAGMAYASDIKSPADVASALTGKSVSDVSKERESGKTYGTIAKDAGKLDEFKAQMLEQRKAILDQRVKDGIMTQQQADDSYSAIKNNQATCEGTGNAKIGKTTGAGFGKGSGSGRVQVQGQGQGQGKGQGMVRGAGVGNGGCSGAGCGMGNVQ